MKTFPSTSTSADTIEELERHMLVQLPLVVQSDAVQSHHDR